MQDKEKKYDINPSRTSPKEYYLGSCKDPVNLGRFPQGVANFLELLDVSLKIVLKQEGRITSQQVEKLKDSKKAFFSLDQCPSSPIQ